MKRLWRKRSISLPATLKPGTSIQIGEYQFVLHSMSRDEAYGLPATLRLELHEVRRA